MPEHSRLRIVVFLVALAGSAWITTGCRKKEAVRANPPPVAFEGHPAPTEPEPLPLPPAAKPEPIPELVVPPPKIEPPPLKPAPATKKTSPPPDEKIEAEAAANAPASPKPAPPQISPRLSRAQINRYRQKTNQAIATAERNMQGVNGKVRSPAQQDLLEKIRGFLSQAREAMRAGDWVRAESLAQKALILSEELLHSTG